MKHWGSLQTPWGFLRYIQARKHFYLVQFNFTLVSWHCFSLQFHFKLGIIFFYTGTFLQKCHTWLHKLHIELWNPCCLTSFEILQNNNLCKIQRLPPLCYKVPVDSKGLPRPAPMIYFSKILIAMLQLMLSLRVARFHQMWAAQERFIWKDKTRNILLSLRHYISFRTWT